MVAQLREMLEIIKRITQWFLNSEISDTWD